MTDIDRGKDISGLELGFPFDLLFDRQCELEYWTKKGVKRIPAIKLPREKSPGTGNIVILGPPGSGKSTLAMQFAVACAKRFKNKANAAYISLETTLDELMSKATPFGWRNWLRPVRQLSPADESAAPEELANSLKCIFELGSGVKPQADDKRDKDIDFARRVLLCSLSPRAIESGTEHEELYWRRYQQLEKLLNAAKYLSENDKYANWIKIHMGGREVLPLVVIDSLNMFGSRPLSREEVFRLFGLFRAHMRIAVFVVESSQDTLFDSTIADVVISLTSEKDRGYFVRHFEIEKSRYYHQVYGFHPYKIFSPKSSEKSKQYRLPQIPSRLESEALQRHGVIVYPSLHYIVLRTEPPAEEPPESTPVKEPEYFGFKDFEAILPPNLKRPSVIAIEGPRGTFKTGFALNFLFNGLLGESAESALLIRFSDSPLPSASGEFHIPLSRSNALKKTYWERLKEDRFGESGAWQNITGESKARITVWQGIMSSDGKDKKKTPELYELDFKGGALLPEEFVHIVREFIIRRPQKNRKPIPISRVVLDDVSQIGVSYPFLRHSITTGDLFLSSLVHIMRNAGIDLVMTGTTGGLAAADEIVSRACSLADTVVSCGFCDVFGERRVIVRGEGLMTVKAEPEQTDESVPAIVRLRNEGGLEFLDVDAKYLQGLVGFETGRIQRPGLAIHLFEQNATPHGRYNKEIRIMLEAGVGSYVRPEFDDGRLREERLGQRVGPVTVLPFYSSDSEAIHDSLKVLGPGAPLDKTVLCTVDEFGAPLAGTNSNQSKWPDCRFHIMSSEKLKWEDFIQSEGQGSEQNVPVWPYYANVLLVAYRINLPGGQKKSQSTNLLTSFERPTNWTQIRDAAKIYTEYEQPVDTTYEQPVDTTQSTGKKPIAALPAVARPFWVDLSAGETLSCMLMDALATAHSAPPSTDFKFLWEKPNKNAVDRQVKQLHALCELFHMTGKWTDIDERVLPDDAGVYVCWYSQLRELIERCPSLAEHIGICPLPGKGFKGDWFIGIKSGSVSPALGRSIIEMLCSKDEDYKRFALGVGLPARKTFYDAKADMFCWPRGQHVPLAKLRDEIHKPARSRRDVKYKGQSVYQELRSTLYLIARQLTPMAGPKPEDIQKHVNKIVIERLSSQLRLLLPPATGLKKVI